MKVFKWLGIGVGVIVALLIVLVVIVVLSLDAVAKTAIEKGGTYALGVKTTLGSASVGVLSGDFSMQGLDVANVEGFDGPHFMALTDGGVQVSMGTLRQETVELPSLTLDGLDVYLEKSGGKSNYGTIMENLQRFESKGEGGDTPKQEKEGAGKTFVVREVVITNVSVHADLLPIGGTASQASVTIPEIRMTDLGNDKPLDMGQLVNVLVQAVMTAIVELPGGLLPGDIGAELKSQLGNLEALGDAGVKIVGDIQSQVEQIGQQAEQIGEQVEGIGEQVEGAAQGIRDLLGGGKDEE